MRLKYQYALFIFVLHLLLTFLIYNYLKEQKWMFLLSEIGIIASLIISYKVYQSLIQPLELMRSGVNAIKDGDYNVKFLKTNSSEMNELITVYNAMLDQLRNEGLRTQEQAYFLENLISASPVGIIILDYNDKIAEINSKAKSILKIRSKVIGIAMEEVSNPLSIVIRSLNVGENKIISPDGIRKFKCQVNQIIHKGFQRKYILIEELSRELLENEKAAYGKVIRMMAHEVNNSMGAVNSILQSVVDFAFEDGDGEYVEALNLARDRNEDLALFMKRFADVIRLPLPVKVPTNLFSLMEGVIEIMRPMAQNHNVEILFKYKRDQIMIPCDPTQIQQVLVNIIKNAVESIEEAGIIQVHLYTASPHIVISDNGTGITPEVKERLFSPFFSTKPTGQGIGLIITRDILLNHNAVFSLASNENTGLTTFEIGF
ncbi:MAG: two-component system nitrogen regulation sensor histidine kinase NtrY [Saprospiraceae bacterium]|jgi:two-component system nitrogen regulation sensor histidine kinase NtrY